MAKWEDTTSYHQGERRGEAKPRSWGLDLGCCKLVVTKYHGCGDEWHTYCLVQRGGPIGLGTEDLEEAKHKALQLAAEELRQYDKAAKKIQRILSSTRRSG